MVFKPNIVEVTSIDSRPGKGHLGRCHFVGGKDNNSNRGRGRITIMGSGMVSWLRHVDSVTLVHHHSN